MAKWLYSFINWFDFSLLWVKINNVIIFLILLRLFLVTVVLDVIVLLFISFCIIFTFYFYQYQDLSMLLGEDCIQPLLISHLYKIRYLYYEQIIYRMVFLFSYFFSNYGYHQPNHYMCYLLTFFINKINYEIIHRKISSSKAYFLWNSWLQM